MFDNYEPLICKVCGKSFNGRRPNEGVDILCPDCIHVTILPLIQEGDYIPLEVEVEFEGGRGNG